MGQNNPNMIGAQYNMMPPHHAAHAQRGYPPNMQIPPHLMQHPGYPPHPHQGRMPHPVGYPPHHPYHHPNMPPPGYPYMQYRPPPNHGYATYAVPQSSATDPKRRREFEVDRPAKRQKTGHHDRFEGQDRDFRRDHRKKHRSKHEKRHRGRGRRSNKDGMQIDHVFYATTSRMSVVEYYDDDDCEEQTEYLFVYYMFAFLAFCYAFFGNKHGMIW